MTGRVVGLVGAVITVVVGVSMTETIVTSVSSALAAAVLAGDQPLTEVVLPFLSTIYTVGILGIAGAIGYASFKR